MIPEVNERCTNIKIGKNEFFSVPIFFNFIIWKCSIRCEGGCGSFSDDFDLIVTDNVQDHTILQHLHEIFHLRLPFCMLSHH